MRISFLLLLTLALPARAQLLERYLDREDKSYTYDIRARQALDGGQGLAVQLTSQTWRGHKWTHWLRILRPTTPRHLDALLLVVAGGRNGRGAPKLDDRAARYLLGVGKQCGCTVAVLEQVPNQPLFAGKKEDAIIALTFDRFLKTGEEDWPLLLPMVKSAVRAVDTVDAVGKLVWKKGVTRVCVTGASKRGWTTWLTSAIDRRVVAIAPMVIDTLDVQRQMPHQLKAWGRYSDSIRDYTRLDLPRRMRSDPRGPLLVKTIDPWHYRTRLTQPKLILLGTNDPYWPLDAANLYFDALPGERLLHYVANAGHGLDSSAVPAVQGFFRLVLDGNPRPRLTWRVQRRDARAQLTVLADRPVASAKLWTAAAPTRDFRKSRWTSSALPATSFGGYVATLDKPTKGFRAMYVELRAKTAAGELSVASRVVIVAAR